MTSTTSRFRDPCAACGADGLPCWQVLRVSTDVEGEHGCGFIPLCPFCLPRCRACARPVPEPAVWRLVERLEGEGTWHLTWWVDPCDDPTHPRPAEVVALEPLPEVHDAPRLELPRPDWRTVAPKIKDDIFVGDQVVVDGEVGVGTLVQVFSSRLGGAACTVAFPDGSSTTVRPTAVHAAFEKEVRT